MGYLKRNKWVIFLVCLLIIFTPTVVFARGFHGGEHFGGFHDGETHVFHDDEGTGFHDDEGTGHTFHDGNEDGTNTHHNDEETDGDTQSFWSRIKDTFNYLVPRKWHSHQSFYYCEDDYTYYMNHETAVDQLSDFLGTIFVVLFTVWISTSEKIENKIKDFISNLLSYKNPVKGKHSIKK